MPSLNILLPTCGVPAAPGMMLLALALITGLGVAGWMLFVSGVRQSGLFAVGVVGLFGSSGPRLGSSTVC